MCIGIIDIGSNTVRLAVYEVKEKKYKKIFSKKKMLGLISYIEKNKISEEGAEKLAAVLREFDGIMDLLCIRERHYFATASMRDIDNKQEVLKWFYETLGVSIEVISGEEEGYLDFLAVSKDKTIKDSFILDVGGGSTELIEMKHEEAVSFCSFPIGCLNLFHRHVGFILPKKDEMTAVIGEIEDFIGDLELPKKKKIIGVGGTCRAAASICSGLFYNGKKMKKITLKDITCIISMACREPVRLSREILKKKPDRIHTLIPGILILSVILERAGAQCIEVENVGIKEGYLLKHVIGDAYDQKI